MIEIENLEVLSHGAYDAMDNLIPEIPLLDLYIDFTLVKSEIENNI
jgi:hypothetical protein